MQSESEAIAMKRSLPMLAAAVLLTLSGCSGAPEYPIEEQNQLQIVDSSSQTETELVIVEPETGRPALESAQTLPPVLESDAASEPESETTAQTTEDSDTPYDAGELSVADESLVVEATLDPDGVYTTKDDVALYIYTYGELPSNFITKKEAQKLGWSGGSLEPYAPGCCIGGSYFGNYEGLLPEKNGREYTECDIDTLGKKSRGAKRIVFSNDGLIYYTDDHYESFELLYGEE